VAVICAPVLHDVAGKLAGRDPAGWSEDPMRWAYAVREAVSMVKPDWVVSHFDTKFECGAIAKLATAPDEVWDVAVVGDGPFAPGIELVSTLASLDPSWTVAASVTGPVTTARLLCEHWELPAQDMEDLQDACGDVIAALAAAYAEAGASEIIVWEQDAPDASERMEAVHSALAKRAAHVGIPVSLVGPARCSGYTRTVGAGIRALDANLACEPAALRAALSDVGPGTVALTDGPVPGDAAPEALLGFTVTATAGGR
jgi:hypothetical protein